jgi:anti-sigma-K factor RskA
MSHESRRDDLLLCAAGALEGPERESLEAHLRSGCAVCAADLAAAESVVAALASSAGPVEPPPEVKARLLGRVARSRDAWAPSTSRPSSLADWPARLLAAGLAAVVAAGLGAALVERFVAAPLREREAGIEGRLRILTEELAELRTKRGELLTRTAEQDEELVALEEAAEGNAELIRFLRAPGLQSVALTATARQPTATARVFWDWEDYACHLHASGLLPLAPGRVYAQWLHTHDGGTIRVGTFRPDSRAEANVFARLPRDVGRVVRTTVTEEAIDAGEQPSGAIQLAAAVVDPRH